jgi:flagellar hook-associated protein 2
MRPQDMELTVQQTAQAQRNEGYTLTADARYVSSGAFSFEIEVGDSTHTFNINVLDSDDNESIQRRMAQAINTRNIGVTASVATETTGTGNNTETTSTLNLTAAQTGTNNAFTVTDVTGNLADAMGVTTVDQEARNAIFSVNGGFERHSQSNEVSLAAGVTATLRYEGTTDISFARPTNEATRAVTDLVNSINSAISDTNARDGRGSARFLDDLRGMNRTFAPALARVGISVNNDGRLSIDQDRLSRAAEDGSLARLFENDSFGFGARVGRIAQNAAQSNFYVNAPSPVNISSGMGGNFNFGNTFDTWSVLNMFG